MTNKTSGNLRSRSIAGLKWSYIGTVLRVLMQLFAQIVIARNIGVQEFGTASAAILISAFAVLIVEMGISSALIQSSDCNDSDITFVFWRTMVVSLLAVLVIVFLADWICILVWGGAESSIYLRMMAISVVVQSFGLTSLAILRRNLEFKTINIIQAISYMVGFVCVGVGAALSGAGAWSLVAAWICQGAVMSALLYRKTQHPLKVPHPWSWSNDNISTYGFVILRTNILNWTIENIDNVLVGRLFGSASLGLYTVSYNLVRTPVNHMVTALQQVIFPASARIERQNNLHRLSYMMLLWALSLASFSIFFSIAALSEPVIDIIYGERWGDASKILFPLAIAMPFHALMAVGGPMLWGRGEARKEMKIQFIIVATFVATFLVFAGAAIETMAWAVAAIYAIRCIAIQAEVARSLGIPRIELFGSMMPGLAVGSVLLAAVTVANTLAEGLFATAPGRMLIGLAAVAVVLAPLVRLRRYAMPRRMQSAVVDSELSSAKVRRLLGLP